MNRINHPKTNGCCRLTRIFLLLLRVQNQTWLYVYDWYLLYFCKIDIFESLFSFNTNDFEVNRRLNELIINSNQPRYNQPELLNDCSQLKTNQPYRLSTGELSKSIIWPCSYMSLFLSQWSRLPAPPVFDHRGALSRFNHCCWKNTRALCQAPCYLCLCVPRWLGQPCLWHKWLFPFRISIASSGDI